MKNQRLYYLDNLKGLLIILVVLGHAIQNVDADYQHNILFRFIYSFHMPLFFMISGYLTYKAQGINSKVLGRRAKQLLLPFATWAILLPLLREGQFDFSQTAHILFYPDNGLWFLYNLFVYVVIAYLSERTTNAHVKQEVSLGIVFILMGIAASQWHTLFNTTQLCWYASFFFMGYYTRKYMSLTPSRTTQMLIGGGIF